MTTFMSLCSGGAGADYGAQLAGLEHLAGVEYDQEIASVAWLNGFATIIADIRAVDYSDLTRPDWLHASTPCINASVANKNAGEADLDMELAQAVCRAIVALKPDYFSLENVRGYINFKAYQAIKECLLANDYKYIDGVLNAADYGTPQTRVRLFLVASRVSTPKLPLPTHYDARSGAMNMLLKPWVGWYEAISDLIDDLPETQFAPWQLKRLPADLKTSLLDTMNSVRDATIREPNEPSYTIKANHMRRPSTQPMAYIIGNSGYDGNLQIQDADQPMNTVTSNQNQTNLKAYLVGGGNTNTSELRDRPVRNITDPAYTVTGSSDRDRAYLINSINASQQYSDGLRRESQPKPKAYIGRVVKLSPRCLARFNDLGDDYKLPTNQSLACKVLGNMVMPLVMKAIIESNV